MTSTAFESAAPIAPSNVLRRAVSAVFATNTDSAATVARLALGLMILPHGLQKAFGLFGGYGFEGTMGFFTGTLGIPAAFAFLAIVADFGTAAVSAYLIGVRILALSFVPGLGFSTAASTLVGQHLGAEAPEKAARSGWLANRGAMVVMGSLGLAIILAAEGSR